MEKYIYVDTYGDAKAFFDFLKNEGYESVNIGTGEADTYRVYYEDSTDKVQRLLKVASELLETEKQREEEKTKEEKTWEALEQLSETLKNIVHESKEGCLTGNAAIRLGYINNVVVAIEALLAQDVR